MLPSSARSSAGSLTQALRALLISFVLLSTAVPTASADPARRLLQLASIPGTSGHETAVRDAIEMALPATARIRADNLGSMTLGGGRNQPPVLLIVAPLDEPGLVISGIEDDGYLRVHRHTPAAAHRLWAQFFVGQPVQIHTAAGALVPGVTATPSTHLGGFRTAADRAHVQTEDDVWIDVGAATAAEVRALGVRELDAVTLRERATLLANGQVAGIAASHRAAATALLEAVQRQGAVANRRGSVAMAWVAQSQFGNRGLQRLVDTLKPDRIVVLRGGVAPADDARGTAGVLGNGVVVAEGDSWLIDAMAIAKIPVQTVAAMRVRVNLGDAYKAIPIHAVAVPALFAQTPVETVDARDVESMAQLVAALASFAPLGPTSTETLPAPEATPTTPATAPEASPAAAPESAARWDAAAWDALAAIGSPYGVSGHEAPVREALLKQMPAWAKPVVDAKGNVSVTMGAGAKPMVFVAHMDETGFEVTAVAGDGSLSVRARGGVLLSVYEAHPVVVHTSKGPVTGVLTPRRSFAAATTGPPASIDELDVYTGATSSSAVAALGIVVGDTITVRKQLTRLAAPRATMRAMDDRAGSTALLLALRRIDPATLTNRVTFVWAVEEEVGLVGAAHVASETRTQKIDTVFAIDTFVSSDTPLDNRRLARAPLGKGAVLRAMDSRTLVRPEVVDRIVAVAAEHQVPLQIGVTSGGTDASAFSSAGAIDVGISWPGRYSHSPVEVMDTRDLAALVNLIVALSEKY